MFSPAGLVHHELIQNNPTGFIFGCRTYDVAMARYVVRINMDGCEEDRRRNVSQVENRLVG